MGTLLALRVETGHFMVSFASRKAIDAKARMAISRRWTALDMKGDKSSCNERKLDKA